MRRITDKDVRAVFARYDDLCESLGVIPEGYHLVLSEGSKHYGNAYRVNLTGNRAADGTYPYGSGHGHPPIGDDFLGMTAREAYENLQVRNQTMYDMVRLLDITRRTTRRDMIMADLEATS